MSKILTKLILASLVLFMLTSNIYSQKAKNNSTNNQAFQETIPNTDLLKQDTFSNTKKTLGDRFNEVRRNNKQNLKKAAKFYNPITFIYRLFKI